jgi:VanZ family protein
VLNSFWKYNIFWLLWLCLISYLSNAHNDGIPNIPLLAFKGADKLVHSIFYLILMVAMSWGFSKQRKYPLLSLNKFFYSFSFSISWGAIMELFQLYVFTYRSAEWADLFANSIGIGIGLMLSVYVLKLDKII